MTPLRHRCKECGITDDEGAHISRRGLCADCGDRRLLEAQAQQRAGSGRAYERWRYGMANPRAPVGRPETPYEPGV